MEPESQNTVWDLVESEQFWWFYMLWLGVHVYVRVCLLDSPSLWLYVCKSQDLEPGSLLYDFTSDAAVAHKQKKIGELITNHLMSHIRTNIWTSDACLKSLLGLIAL